MLFLVVVVVMMEVANSLILHIMDSPFFNFSIINLIILCMYFFSRWRKAFYIIEQYSLRPSRLFASDDSIIFESCDDLLGVEGLDEDLDGGRAFVEDLLFDLLLDEVLLLDLVAEDGVFLLAALAGLTGVMKSCSLLAPSVKLSSLIGDTDDLLFVVDLRVDCDFPVDLLAFELEEEADVFFFIEAGVVLAFDDLGLGVPLMGLEVLLAGVAVCLAIMFRWINC